MVDDLTLLQRYEPVLRLTRGELFHPTDVDSYLAQSALVREGSQGPEVIAGHGSLDRRRLVDLAVRHAGEPLSLRFVGAPMDRETYRAWRRRADRETFTGTSGAAAAGLLARGAAALMRLSLLLRGRVPGGHTAAAYELARAGDDALTCHYYGHVVRDGGYVALQYWFFYVMNDWRSSFGGVNDHEADWEQVTVFVAEVASDPSEDDSGIAEEPVWVAFASHDERGSDLRRRWDDPDLEHIGTHPVVFVGAGSHSAAYLAGDYLVTVAPDLPRWVKNLRARMARILPWWDPETLGIGIPFIDYRRGDGLTVGPGQDRAWVPHVINDRTDWVCEYTGLWGLDTKDPLGGERAPAGPRYERTGAVRRSWAAPVAWADLDGEPPSAAEAARLWEQRPAHLEKALQRVRSDLEEARLDLRSATVEDRALGRSPVDASPERTRARSRVAQLHRQQEELSSLLEQAVLPRYPRPGAVPPQAHLRQRPVPLHQDPHARSLALRVWASASATILFAALGILLIFGGSGVVVPALGLVTVMLLIEAAVRRRLLAFVVNLAALALVAGGAVALTRLLFENLRIGLGVVLLVSAAAMALLTIGDALVRRDPRRE